MIDKEAIKEQIARLESKIEATNIDIKLARIQIREHKKKLLELKQLLWKCEGEE